MALKLVNKFLKQLSKREQIALYVTIMVILGSISFKYIFEPLVARIKNLNSGLASKQLKLIKGEHLLVSKDRIEREFSEIAEDLRFEGTQEQLTSELLNKIEKLSATSRVHITNIKPQRVREFGFYQKMIVEIKLDAPISKIFKFLYDLEGSKDLIEIERIQFHTKTKESDILDAIILVSKISLL